MGFRLTLLAALALLAPSTHTRAAVRVIVGPTPIPGGSARAAGDITIVNEHLAFALAVASPVPYGVPRGALVDLAPVRAGKIGHDRVVFADFIPNNWSAWPNTYQKVEILERGPQEARVRAVRDWGKVRIETLYSLAAGSDRVSISTTMTNEGAEPLRDLLSGLTMWPSSGFRFAVPGLAGVTEGAAEGALARRVTAYDVDWTVTLHAPYLDHVGSGSRDMFQLHTLKPRESRRFSGWLQVGTRGDLAPVVAAEIEQQQLPSGSITGRVSARDGRPLARPVLVVQKDGKPYAWTLGHAGRYTMRLPAGDYSAYATGPNFSRSPAVALRIAPGSRQTRDFGGLEPPGRVEFSVRDARTSAPLDARIIITAGERAPVEFLGRKTFFTALSPKGRLSAPIAPGRYRFEIAAGGGVLAQPVQCEVEVLRGATAHCNAEVRMVFDPVSASLVLGGPAPSRGPGRGGDSPGRSRAIPARRRTQRTLRERSRFDGQPRGAAPHRRHAGCAVHRRHRAVALLGPFQRLSAQTRRPAHHRHRHRIRWRGVQGGAPHGRGGGAG